MASPLRADDVRHSPPPQEAAAAPALAIVPARPAPARELPRLRLPHTALFFGAIVAMGWLAILLFAVAESLANIALMVTAGLLAFTTLLAAFRVLSGLVSYVRTGTGPSALALLGNLLMTAFGMLVAYLSTMGFSRGRQLRRFGRVLAPPLADGPAWTTEPIVLGGDEPPPAGLAEQWRENGRGEHASVAAFARLTLDLMALGAPPRLVAEANRDALDEIRHAELCFSLAQAIDGQAVSPGPFPAAQHVSTLPRARRLALARLAVSSLIDGALHEGVSARIIAALARRTAVPAVRALLKELAADEGRHAAHGWTVVRWCLQEGGWPVAQALLGALRTLPRQMRSALPAAAAGGAWERWGIHGHGLEAAEYAAALDQLVERVRAEVAPVVRTAA